MSNVNPLFQQYLGRAATAADEAFYNGQTDRQVVDALTVSPEYRRRAAHQAAFPMLGADQVGAIVNGTPEAKNAFLNQTYQNIFGRQGDAEGLAYWSDPTRLAAALGDGTLFDNFVGQGVMSDPNGTMPWDQTAARAVQADQWADYRQQAEAATAGINRMPSIFSDFGSVPTDAAAKNAMFYLSGEDAQKAVASNPLLSGVIQGGAARAEPAIASDNPNSTYMPRVGAPARPDYSEYIIGRMTQPPRVSR